MSELETLQGIVADGARSAEERKAAAEHILALEGQQSSAPVPKAAPVQATTQTKRRFTEQEQADLSRLKSVMAELKRESEQYSAALERM
jgi:hypothetical protein